MQLQISDWHIANTAVKADDIFLIDWENTKKAPTTSEYQRIKGAMAAFMKWLPGFASVKAVGCHLRRQRDSTGLCCPKGCPDGKSSLLGVEMFIYTYV